MSIKPRDAWINGELVGRRMHELRLSVRDLAKRSNMSSRTIQTVMLSNLLTRESALCDLQKLAQELQVSMGDLLARVSQPTDTGDPSGDVKTLLSLLNRSATAVKVDQVGLVLGWTLERAEEVAEEANAALEPLGLTIHHASTGLLVRPITEETHRAYEELLRLRDDSEGLTRSPATVLYLVWQGALGKKNIKNNERVQIAALRNRGAVREGRGPKGGGTANVLTEAAAFALDF